MVEPKYMDDFDVERADCQLAKGFVKAAQSCLSFQAYGNRSTKIPWLDTFFGTQFIAKI